MTGIIVLCRYNSSRLPGKVLKMLHGKPLLQYIVERLRVIKNDFPFVICTSEESTEDPIASYCEENNLPIYRGALENVALRFLKCAKAFDFSYAVRINGDNLFLDPWLINDMIQIVEKKNLDFISNVKNRTFPSGMSIEIVKTAFYEHSFPQFEPSDMEHVMTYFYRQEHFNFEYIYNPERIGQSLNLAIDTQEDLDNANKILGLMEKDHTKYNYKEIIKLFQRIADEK